VSLIRPVPRQPHPKYDKREGLLEITAQIKAIEASERSPPESMPMEETFCPEELP